MIFSDRIISDRITAEGRVVIIIKGLESMEELTIL
jgi:hypothetical protein